MMKKYIFLLLMVISNLIVIAQSEKKTLNNIKDSTLKDQALFEDMLKNASTNKYKSKMGSVSSEMSSTYHGQNISTVEKTNKTNNIKSNKSDFGSSKYDSEINWASDIDENDIQRSLNKYRQKRHGEELQIYINILIGVITISILILIYSFKRK